MIFNYFNTFQKVYIIRKYNDKHMRFRIMLKLLATPTRL
jgi:hypothetical protein